MPPQLMDRKQEMTAKALLFQRNGWLEASYRSVKMHFRAIFACILARAKIDMHAVQRCTKVSIIIILSCPVVYVHAVQSSPSDSAHLQPVPPTPILLNFKLGSHVD